MGVETTGDKDHMERLGLKRLIKAIALLLFLLFGSFLVYFPGQQSLLALSLATGIGIPGIQERIDKIEANAISRTPFSQRDKNFLHDLYTCMAKGAKLTNILRQSGEMMAHYLSCSGEPLRTDPEIFTLNTRVSERAESLRSRMLRDLGNGTGLKKKYSTDTFYMPHKSSPDSVFGLYYGRVMLYPRISSQQEIILDWRAEVPWEWPSYDHLYSKYGNYHAESFPLPNLRSIIQGRVYALHIDNGLGEYLARLGLAESFLVFAEWQETMKLP
jgi:hypothetical protein